MFRDGGAYLLVDLFGDTFASNVLAALDALNLSQARCIRAPFMQGTNCFALKLYVHTVPCGKSSRFSRAGISARAGCG